MSVLVPYGKQWDQLKKVPSLEHELFFSYLLISPSYQKVNWIKRGKENGPVPKELIDVEKLYDKLGNVFGISFDEWWNLGANNLFFTNDLPEVLTVNLDIKKPSEILLAEMKELISSIDSIKNKSDTHIKFLSNKIRIETLSERYWLIAYKAYKIFYHKKIENWRIGAFLNSFPNVEASWAEELKGVEKPTSKNLEARERVGRLVSKMTREALFISENAARGRFPSKEPLQCLDFDYLRTYQFVLKHQFKYLSTREKLISDKKTPMTEKKWIKHYKKD